MKTNPFGLIGVDQHHAHVYLAMLSLGSTTPQEISRRTNLKRPTVYVYLENLMQKGLVTKIQQDKKVFYRAVQIKTVENRVEDAYKQFKETLPSLVALTTSAEGKPHIEILEGEQGILTAYEDMVNAKSFRFWSDLGKVQKLFSAHFLGIAECIRKRQITTREIITGSKESIKSSRAFGQHAGATYNARVATVGGIMNDSVIYDDTITLFRMHDYNMYVVRIKDATIASSLSALFDMAWKSSVSLKDFNDSL